MVVRLYVISGDTGQALESATVQIVDSANRLLGQGVQTGISGKVIIDSSLLNGNFLLISYAGMIPVKVDVSVLNSIVYTEVPLFSTVLEEIVVTPKKKIGFGWWILIGSLFFVIKARKNG